MGVMKTSRQDVPANKGAMRWWIAGACILTAGAVIGVSLYAFRQKGTAVTCDQELINPAACKGELAGKVGFEAFRRDLEDNLTVLKQKGDLIEAGIYFRDLRFGPTFGLNEDAQFLPMSLMKMPMMVVLLKAAETRPGLLDETVRTPDEFAANVQLMKPAETLTPGREYTVGELLTYLIAYSDNKALWMISDWMGENVAPDAIADTMVNLGLMRRQDAVPATSITPKMYGSILRILYNAAYLDPEHSQYALDLLTQTRFADGIAHGVPGDVRVAHKFGVRDDTGADVQLHDCGIVYHPAGAYILCVMTRGKDFDTQARYVQDVSERVYAEMTRRAVGE